MVLNSLRGPKKKEEIVVESNDIVNIYKDQEDPVLLPLNVNF